MLSHPFSLLLLLSYPSVFIIVAVVAQEEDQPYRQPRLGGWGMAIHAGPLFEPDGGVNKEWAELRNDATDTWGFLKLLKGTARIVANLLEGAEIMKDAVELTREGLHQHLIISSKASVVVRITLVDAETFCRLKATDKNECMTTFKLSQIQAAISLLRQAHKDLMELIRRLALKEEVSFSNVIDKFKVAEKLLELGQSQIGLNEPNTTPKSQNRMGFDDAFSVKFKARVMAWVIAYCIGYVCAVFVMTVSFVNCLQHGL